MKRSNFDNYPESVTDGSRIEDDSWQNSSSVNVSALAINSFLGKTISELKPDLIISELRKGSWIIDTYLQVNGLSIPHKSSESVLSEEDYEGKKVMIFDDSVHTGSSVMDIFDRIKGSCDASICCIALNTDAMRLFKKHGIDVRGRVRYFRSFKKYREYESNHLTEDCQSYFYTYVMIPYIGWLIVNQSPDFTVCRAIVEYDDKTSLDNIAKAIYEALDIDFSFCNVVSSSRMALRYSAPMDDSVYDYVRLNDVEKEYAKLRISVAELHQSLFVTITPIISFMTSDGCSKEQLMYAPGERYLTDNETKIKETLNRIGKLSRFDIVRGYEVGLPKEVDP